MYAKRMQIRLSVCLIRQSFSPIIFSSFIHPSSLSIHHPFISPPLPSFLWLSSGGWGGKWVWPRFKLTEVTMTRHTYINTSARRHIHTYKHTHNHTLTHRGTPERTHKHTNMQTHKHTCTNTHSHIHTCTPTNT